MITKSTLVTQLQPTKLQLERAKARARSPGLIAGPALHKPKAR